MIEPDPPRHIRPARVEEAATLSELCFRSKASWGYDAEFMVQALEALRVSPVRIAAGDVWVALAGAEQIAGVVALAAGTEPGTVDLDLLFIEPCYLRHGFGRALLGHAVNEARRRGVRRMTILADPYAAAFYQREGARLIGEAPSDAIPGRMVPLLEMQLGRRSAPSV